MDTALIFGRKDTIIDYPELRDLKVLYGINMFLIITTFLMPQYFGIDIGYDITCTRFSLIILFIYVLINPKIFRVFTKNCINVLMTIPLALYLFVSIYTMVYRVDINAFMLVFLEILAMYVLFFGIRFVIGVRKSFKAILFCAYFLGIYGVVEFVAGHSLYLQFLRTLPTHVVNSFRSGHYRIMGPCGHPLGYGLLLLIFVGVSCIDLEKDDIYLFRRPFLLIVLLVNVFLTGSRSTLAICIMEMILVIIFSKGNYRKKALWYCFVGIFVLGVFILATFKTPIGRYVLMQITSVIDLAFDTQLSAKFGADVSTLEGSEDYREYLPRIFGLDWLNPLIGRGVKHQIGVTFTAEDGSHVYIHSIDNFYVSQFIKYAYPGLVTFSMFIITTVFNIVREIIKRKSGVYKGILICFVCYFFNLWYLDALQTLKFIYVIVAWFLACVSALNSIEKTSPLAEETNKSV